MQILEIPYIARDGSAVSQHSVSGVGGDGVVKGGGEGEANALAAELREVYTGKEGDGLKGGLKDGVPSLMVDQDDQLRQILLLERLVEPDGDNAACDPTALAWLRGERVVYTMATREIVVGRETDVSVLHILLCTRAWFQVVVSGGMNITLPYRMVVLGNIYFSIELQRSRVCTAMAVFTVFIVKWCVAVVVR